MPFFLLIISSLQQNWRRRQNRFFLEATGMGEREGIGNGPSNICTYEYMGEKITYL
jgi:hypothetical protein